MRKYLRTRKNRETCQQYVARRLSEGWKIVWQQGYQVLLGSPDGNILRPVDLRNDVETLRPNAVGAYTMFNRLPGTGEANWQDVDDVTPDDIDTCVYAYAVEGGAVDFYNITNPTFPDGATINKVTLYARCRQAAASYPKGYYGIYSGTTPSWSAETIFGSSFANYSKVYTTDPNTGVAWTKAAITALQIGVSVGIHADDGMVCTQIYVEVDYTPAVTTPTVTTQACTAVEATTATGNGTIADTGGANCTRRGFCYKVGTSGDPTTADSVAYDDGSFPAGVYTKAITGLSPGTSYRVRAYAVNSAGTGYGTTVQILTKPAAPTGVAASDGAYTDKVVITWTKSPGATGYQVYRDGAALGWLGDVATYDDTGAAAPSITPGSAIATDGSSTAQVNLSLSGTSVSNGTTHIYVVRARNATGESADSSSNTGYRGHGSLTYQWQRSAADSDASYSNIVGATSSTYSDTEAPAPTVTPGTAAATDGSSTAQVTLSLAGESANIGAGRYYKCVLNATGCTQQISASNRGYRGVGSLTRQWYRSAGDSDADYSSLAGATTDPYDDTEAPAPTINHGSITASDEDYTDKVALANTGASANVGAGRYYKCLVSATGATSQYSTSDRGYRGVGSLTYQWYRSAADSDADYSSLAGATLASHNDTTAPAPTITPGSASASDGLYTTHVALSLSGQSANVGAGRYYKCYHTADGASSDYTGSNRGYRGVGSLTYQWQRSAGDSDASYSDISGATTASYNDTGAPAPTITPGSTVASDGSSTAQVDLSLSGTSANVGAGRYYKCVLNAVGATQQTSASDRGYRSVGSLTYQWQRSAGDSDGSYSDISGATTASYNDTGAPADGSGRYYKCVENATGAAQQTSTSNRGYRATYYASGYIGDVIDCTALVDTYDRLEWTEELDSQDIGVKIRSSPDNATWSTWETIYSSPCTSFTTPVKRYLEWRATLSSDTMATPKLKDLTFNWTKKVE